MALSRALGSFIQPIAPGLPGSVNPLTFIGAGMASGDIGGAMGQMATIQAQQQQIQQRAQQVASQNALRTFQMQQARQQAERRKELEAQAPDIVAGIYSGDPEKKNKAMATYMTLAPETLGPMISAQMKAEQPSGAMRSFGQFLGMPPELQQKYLEYQRAMSPFAGLQSFQQAPLSESAAKWQNEAGEQPSPEMTPQQATQAGFRPTTKAQQEQEKTVRGLITMQDSLNRYRDVLKATGPEMVGSDVPKLKAAYTDVLMQAKEMNKLGALTGPDLDLMQSMLTDPTGIGAQWLEKTGRAESLTDQLDQVQQMLNDRMARARGEEPEMKEPTAEQTEAPGGVARIRNDTDYDALPSGTVFIDPNGVQRRKP